MRIISLRPIIVLFLLLMVVVVVIPSTLAEIRISSEDNANYPQSIYNLSIDEDYTEYDKEYQWFSNDDPIPSAIEPKLNCRLYWLNECKAFNDIYVKVRYYINTKWTAWETSNKIKIKEIKFDHGKPLVCETGELQLVYGRYMCIMDETKKDYGIDEEYLQLLDYPILNIGLIIWPTQPYFGWIILGVILIVIFKCLKCYSSIFKNIRERFE